MNNNNEKQTLSKERVRDEVKRIVDKKGIEYVAELFAKDNEYIKNILSGKIGVDERDYLKITKETGCTYDYLIYRDNARNDEERKRKLEESEKKYEESKKELEEAKQKYKEPRDIYGTNSNKTTNKSHPYAGTRAQEELEKLIDEKGMELEDVANELNITKKATINLKNGNQNISKKHYEKIAEMANCSIDYLNGTTDIRNNKELLDKEKQLKYLVLIEQKAMKGLETLFLKINSTISELNDIKIYENNKCIDIVSNLIADVNFWETLIIETDKFIRAKTNLQDRNNFENKYNRNIDIDYEETTKFTPEDMAINRISKALLNFIFKYISGKEAELGLKEIDFEKEEQNSVWKILENKDKKK